MIFVLLMYLTSQMTFAENYTFHFSLSDFQIINTTDGTIVLPVTEDFVMSEDTMLPALPIKNVNILLPENTSISSCSYLILEQTIVPGVSHIGNNLPIVPSDDVFLEARDDSSPNRSGNPYPAQHVSLISENHYGTNRYVTIQICPFRYYADSCLFFTSQIQVSLEVETSPYPTQTGKCNLDILKRILLNPDSLPEILSPTNNQQTIDYVIITSDSLKQVYQPLKNWKTIKGINTRIITLEEIYSTYTESTPQLKIKRCLYDYYNNHGTTWVLLGGDDSIVPVMGCYGSCGGETDTNIPCDLFYACFEGQFDWNANGNDKIGELYDGVNIIPNIYVSRLPIRTKDHVKTYVQKLLRYEQNPPLQNYAKRLLLCGEQLWNTYPSGESDAQLKSEMFYNRYIQPNWSGSKYKFYDTDTDFGGSTYDLIPANINEQFNIGYHFVHYAAHGNPTFWSTETSGYTPTYVAQLGNKELLSTIVTMACSTNSFDGMTDPCLSEAFIRDSVGAICYFGSSRYGWGTKNPSITSISLGPSFRYNGTFFQSLFRDDIFHFSEIATNAKVAWSSYFTSPVDRWLQYSLNPVGDAELPIYTEDPLSFSTVAITETDHNLSVNTNGINNCTITVTSAEDYGETYFEVQNDVASAVFHNVPESYFLVITKHNYVPYVYSSTSYIQNEIISTQRVVDNSNNVFAGEQVTPIKPQGKVIIQSLGELIIPNANEVVLDEGFEVKLGGKLEIQ